MFNKKTVLLAALALPSGPPQIELSGFELVETKDHMRSLELEARHAQLYKAHDLTGLNQLTANIWGARREFFTIKGDVGILDTKSQNFQINEGGSVLTPEGLVFSTSELFYSAKQKTVESSSQVSAVQNNESDSSMLNLKGRGLLMNLNEGTYLIKSQVRAEQRISANNSFIIRAQQGKFIPQKKSALFTGTVKVNSSEMEMVGDRLTVFFERFSEIEVDAVAEAVTGSSQSQLRPQELLLEANNKKGNKKKKINAKLPSMKIVSEGLRVFFNNSGEMIRSEAVGLVNAETEEGLKIQSSKLVSDTFESRPRILMSGDVTILVDERTAKCEEAQYFPDTGEIILQSVASIVNKDQTLEGDVIRFSTRSSQITVEKVRGNVEAKSFNN